MKRPICARCRGTRTHTRGDKMTYFESAEGITIDKERALYEVKRHNGSAEEFLEEMGDRVEYMATEVLEWLGY
jgi:hypothetical protein